MSPLYLWSKLLKKLRGHANVGSAIHKTSKVESGSLIVNTTFDRHSFCGYDCSIVNCDIGSFCSIANNVIIGAAAHPVDWVSTSPVFYEGRDSVKAKFSHHKRMLTKRTIICHDVWIGERAFIKQGVTIGNGAVIGMGSIVTKDVMPYTIVAGCPAKEIRKRFEDEIVAELLSIKWWDFHDEVIRKYAGYFTEPAAFIRVVRESSLNNTRKSKA
jgi:acetyltransferase-like isoleucine patch superfamily enzyme